MWIHVVDHQVNGNPIKCDSAIEPIEYGSRDTTRWRIEFGSLYVVADHPAPDSSNHSIEYDEAMSGGPHTERRPFEPHVDEFVKALIEVGPFADVGIVRERNIIIPNSLKYFGQSNHFLG